MLQVLLWFGLVDLVEESDQLAGITERTARPVRDAFDDAAQAPLGRVHDAHYKCRHHTIMSGDIAVGLRCNSRRRKRPRFEVEFVHTFGVVLVTPASVTVAADRDQRRDERKVGRLVVRLVFQYP